MTNGQAIGLGSHRPKKNRIPTRMGIDEGAAFNHRNEKTEKRRVPAIWSIAAVL